MNCKKCGSDIPDDAQFCPNCGEVLELEEKSPIETPIVDNKLEDDFNIVRDWVTENNVLHQGMRTKIYLQVAKLVSSPVYGAKVQLSGPPEVNIVVSSRKIHPKKPTNKLSFPISAEEPGLFNLTAILTSDAGHQIAYSFKIQVEPTRVEPTKMQYTNIRGIQIPRYTEEKRAKPFIRTPVTSSIGTARIIAFAIFVLIGGILLISGIINIPNLFESVFSMEGNPFPIAIPLVLSGIIVLFIAFGIISTGGCCGSGDDDSCCYQK